MRSFWSGILLVVASLCLGAAAMAGVLKGFDRSVFDALVMSRAYSPDAAIAVTQFITRIGDPGWRAGIMLLILFLLIYRRCWRSATVFVVTVGVSITGHSIVKEAFARARPALATRLDSVDTYSYPSGHAAGAAVILLLGTLLLGTRKAISAGVLLTLAIGLSRIALGVHWPSDVVGGWMFGGGTALIGYAMARRVGRGKEGKI